MRFFRFFILLMAMAAVSCSHRSETYRQLVQIDSLLLGHIMDDSAAVLMRDVEPQTKEDTAYYNILLSALEYNQNWIIKSIEPLDFSVNYYTKKYDNEKLAYAYYYKAIYYVSQYIFNEDVALLLKNAEKHAENTNNLRLKNRIYATISIINTARGEFDEALKYSDKECTTAKKLRDNYCIAYALMARSMVYKAIQLNDSSEYYIMQCKVFADNLENDDRAFLYNYLGECFMYDNPPAAKKYFFDALKYKKLPDTYANIAKLYYNEDKNEMAELYCDSALINASYAVKKEILILMAEKSYESGNIDKYKQASDELTKTLNFKVQRVEQSRVLELQRKFVFELQRQKFRSRVAFTVLFCVLVIAVLVLLYRIRVRRIENRRIAAELKYNKTQKELALTEERIATLQTDKKSSAMELAALKRKVEALRDTMRQNIQQGRKMYDELCANASPLGWSDSDLLCLFDYLSTLAPEFVSRLDTDYDGLNNGQKLFVIVEQYLKKSDFEICQMFGLEKSSLYNKRNRIVKKRVSAA